MVEFLADYLYSLFVLVGPIYLTAKLGLFQVLIKNFVEVFAKLWVNCIIFHNNQDIELFTLLVWRWSSYTTLRWLI